VVKPSLDSVDQFKVAEMEVSVVRMN
jgi:hypothetical protein